MQRKDIHIKTVGADGTGLARIATLNVIDKDGDVTRPGAFGTQTAKILPAHDWKSVPLGKTRVFEHADEVLADFRLNLAIPAARDWHSALKFDLADGNPVQEYSYGFTVLKASTGQFQGERVRFLESVKVHEVSPVVVGAGMNTTTLAIKQHDPDYGKNLAQSEYIKFLTMANQFNRSEIEAKKILTKAHLRHQIQADGKIPCLKEDGWPWLEKIGRQIAKDLGVFMPILEMFRPAQWHEKHNAALPDCLGCYNAFGCTISLRSDRPRRGLIATLGHELHHHYTHRAGLPPSEEDAEAFGQSIADRY